MYSVCSWWSVSPGLGVNYNILLMVVFVRERIFRNANITIMPTYTYSTNVLK